MHFTFDSLMFYFFLYTHCFRIKHCLDRSQSPINWYAGMVLVILFKCGLMCFFLPMNIWRAHRKSSTSRFSLHKCGGKCWHKWSGLKKCHRKSSLEKSNISVLPFCCIAYVCLSSDILCMYTFQYSIFLISLFRVDVLVFLLLFILLRVFLLQITHHCIVPHRRNQT